MSENRKNTIYEVLTPDGWSDFDSIKSKQIKRSMRIHFNDGSSLGCTENHLLKVEDKFIEAQWLCIGQIISGKTVRKIEYVYDELAVYDLVNVTKNNEYYTNNIISHNCEFQGSSGTLISGYVLKSLTWKRPEIDASIPGLSLYERPMDGRVYALVADSAHGKGQDYSAFVVVDIASVPYRVVAKYMNNTISPVVFPSIIQKMGKYYNDAYVLIENNDIGSQVLQSMFDDYEYENLLSSMNVKKQLQLTWSIGMKKGERGIRTTRSTKRIGCQLLKGLVESYKLKIEDFDIIMQLSTFINKGENFQAEDGSNDDLVMCLVLFAWMTNQKFFSDMCNANIRRKLYEQQMLAMEEEMLPSPLPGDASMENMFVSDGTVWSIVSSDDMFKN